MSIVFTTFIDTYVTSKERWLHTQLFSVSPTGHLRYHPEDRKEHPLRPRNADEVQDISPIFHTLTATTATVIQQTWQAIQTTIPTIVNSHLRQWMSDTHQINTQLPAHSPPHSPTPHHLTTMSPSLYVLLLRTPIQR